MPINPLTETLPVYQVPCWTVVISRSDVIKSKFAQIKPENSRCKFFHDQSTALLWLEANAKKTDSGECPQIQVDFDEQSLCFERRTVSLNLNLAQRKLSESQRFSLVSLVIIDSGMQDIDVVNFLESIAHLNSKKILISDGKGMALGIGAFNRGLIHLLLKRVQTAIFSVLARK